MSKNLTKLNKFFKACENSDLDFINKSIIGNKHLIVSKTPEGWTGLVIASFNENYEAAKNLISNGADINYATEKGTTVFMYAKTPVLKNQKNIQFLEFLIEEGANINVIDKSGKTVLDYVFEKKAYILAEWLISKGALRNIK